MTIALAVPVNSDLHAGDSHDLIITVSNNGASVTQSISVTGLDELTIDGATTVPQLATASTTTYSQITINATPVSFGDAPVVLHATSNIALNTQLNVSASGQTPGPGGCSGGDATAAGKCVADQNGGKAGPNTSFLGTGSGGGGGGYGALGVAGGTPGGGGG